MNLLAGGTDEPCANASIRGAIGKARSIAVGPGSEPPRVRAILFPQLGELTCANWIYGQPPSRGVSALVRRSDSQDFAWRNAVSVLPRWQREYLENGPL